LKRNYQESDFAEEKKLLRLMRELPDETKKLISAAIKSDSAPISAMKKKEKGKCKIVVKAAAVNAYAGDSLAGVELFVNTLNSGPMPGIAVVDARGYDGDHDLRGNDLRFLMAMICAIDKSVIPKSIVPGVPDYFFLSDTGSGVHLGWGRDCCVKRLASHIMISGSDGQTSATTEVGWLALLVPVLVNNSVWATKSVTSGVSDVYIESDANRQILSVPCLIVCATDYNLRADLVDFFIGTHRTTPVGIVWSK
jgi:hypothetical protein